MLCQRCGRTIQSLTRACPHCERLRSAGAFTEVDAGFSGPMEVVSEFTTSKLQAYHHIQYNTFTLLALIVPPAGFILALKHLLSTSELDKKLGEHTMIMSLLGCVLAWEVGKLYLTLW